MLTLLASLAGCGQGGTPVAAKNADVIVSASPLTGSASATVSSSAAAPQVVGLPVPSLVGQSVAAAKGALARQGLRVGVQYTRTAAFPVGTVVGQSVRAGTAVRPQTLVVLTVAVAPPAPATQPTRPTAPAHTTQPAPTHRSSGPPPAPPRPPAQPPKPPAGNCDPAYPGVCLRDGIGDYDCAGGSGNGPNYVRGPIRVLPPDPFGLDNDHDGYGCEK